MWYLSSDTITWGDCNVTCAGRHQDKESAAGDSAEEPPEEHEDGEEEVQFETRVASLVSSSISCAAQDLPCPPICYQMVLSIQANACLDPLVALCC